MYYNVYVCPHYDTSMMQKFWLNDYYYDYVKLVAAVPHCEAFTL